MDKCSHGIPLSVGCALCIKTTKCRCGDGSCMLCDDEGNVPVENHTQQRRVGQMVQAALQHNLDAAQAEELACTCVAIMDLETRNDVRSVCYMAVDRRLMHRSTYKWPKSGVDGIALAEAISKAWQL